MKCRKHNLDAFAVCAYCGRATCSQCVSAMEMARVTCSSECAAALQRAETSLQLILERGQQTLKATAFYCYLCAVLSAAAAVLAWFMLPVPFLVFFAAGCGVVLLISGIGYSRAARKANQWNSTI